MTSDTKTGSVSNVEPLRPRRPCPECGNASSRADFPFCSSRCRDLDLNRWLSGRYAIPVTEEEENIEPSSGESE